MAVQKKKKVTKSKAAPRASKKAAALEPVALSAAAAAPKAGKRAPIIIALVGLLLLGAVGLQFVLTLRKQASLKFSALHVGKIIPQGLDNGQARSPLALQGDKDDNLFFLEGMGDNAARLQKFDKNGNFLAIYKPSSVDQLIDKDVDMDVDLQGEPWILLRDGQVKILSPELKYLRSLNLGVQNATAFGLGPDGRIFVADGANNKIIYFDPSGKKLGEFGAPGTNSGELSSPDRMRVCADGLIAVIEVTPNGLHAKVFDPKLNLMTQFDLKNIQWCDPLRMGVTVDDMMTINDQLTNRGLLVWNLKSGDFYGESVGCTDNTLWNEPGSSGANKFTKSIYVHCAPGLVHCFLPEGPAK